MNTKKQFPFFPINNFYRCSDALVIHVKKCVVVIAFFYLICVIIEYQLVVVVPEANHDIICLLTDEGVIFQVILPLCAYSFREKVFQKVCDTTVICHQILKEVPLLCINVTVDVKWSLCVSAEGNFSRPTLHNSTTEVLPIQLIPQIPHIVL